MLKTKHLRYGSMSVYPVMFFDVFQITCLKLSMHYTQYAQADLLYIAMLKASLKMDTLETEGGIQAFSIANTPGCREEGHFTKITIVCGSQLKSQWARAPSEFNHFPLTLV